ncbi:MAG: SusD/RagB family nutrient-binding outer membrane lipoprotein [Owenweeksia sp.]|nr:SusD/RagB family nutrient-binding outer membrane lipoprotein [Owenweeksia sp.]
MKKINIALLLLLVTASACTKDFNEINKNPNAPEDIAPQFLLSNVLSVSADQNTYDQGFGLANYLAQFAANVEFERIDRYEMGTNSNYWDHLYQTAMDIRSMQRAEGSNEAYQAVGDILQCYLFSQLTDMWADVPYTQALEAQEGNFAPHYDTQESIYTDPNTGLLAVLKKSAATLQNTSASIEGDMMYNNDLSKWVRFANSLRVRYLMRMSKHFDQCQHLAGDLQKLVNSGDLMQSNLDNAVVPYLGSAPNQWPMSLAGLGLYQEHRMTKTVDSILSLWDDPRVEVLYKPTANSADSTVQVYNGLLNGQSNTTISAKGIDLNDISLSGAIYRDEPNGVDGQFMQYAELQFALAEAAERGYIGGSAQSYYEAGIEASFEYYGVTLPAGYFSRPAVALSGTENLTKILTQKWLSLITCGHEAWFNVRRTGIPHLKPGPDNLNSDRYPVRYLYPEGEQATNSENYQKAAGRIGGDNINSKRMVGAGLTFGW